MACDGSMEWVTEPMQASVLLDMADLLDENAKLREDMEDLEGYDQMLRDRLRQETELRVKVNAENAQLRDQLEEQKCFAVDLERDVRALRELVRDLVRWHEVEHRPHEELRFWGDKSSGVYARMRELGVEVDG